ncbi:MAG: hypothetical protein GWN07_21545, partial [Actinobacteria bacterium]|nr:hypothetical protein [Actinomycetota bacterium]NIS33056.1 hypothetical protein [Actinomycetota bacterium]NIU67985.1 hypothetical protein [Actinomycetota bacterium]NIV88315.1 hypothetical protein [Actinomycetota bacterium]NIW29775.1 hypothetical protein [Actinomycetota bacterium]
MSLGGSRYENLVFVPLLVTGAAFIVSYGIAVGRYRLYDIDVVISKTVTYLGLAGAITLLYAAVVVGPTVVIGASDDGG